MGFQAPSPSPPSTTDSLSDTLNAPSYMNMRKRPSEESDEGIMSKRPGSDSSTHGPSQCVVSSSGSTGNSKLWERNRMLAQLLAQQPPPPTAIPPLPPHIISATPQEKLPRVKQQSGGKMF